MFKLPRKIRIHRKKIIRFYLPLALLLIIFFSVLGYKSTGKNTAFDNYKAEGSAFSSFDAGNLSDSAIGKSGVNILGLQSSNESTSQKLSDKVDSSRSDGENGNNSTNAENDGRMVIKAYFPDGQARFLVDEYRIIEGSSTSDYAFSAFEELLKGPNRSDLLNLIPEKTGIINARYEDGFIFLNLSEEFVDNRDDNELADFLIISSIASTIAGIEGVEGVIFKVNEQKIDKYGSLDMSRPFKKNEDLILN